MPVPQALLDLSLSDPAAAIDRVAGFSFSSIASKPSYPGPGVWLRGAARSLMHQVLAAQGDARLFHTDFTACNGYAVGLDAAARVFAPVHLLLGDWDQMTLPRNAREVTAVLQARGPAPGLTQTHALPAGHQLMAECPDGVLQILRNALSPAH
jgi:pimeloyl-ACP methyl ester carboxylesterase